MQSIDLDTVAVTSSRGEEEFGGIINVPVCRASTIAYPDMESYERRKTERGYHDLRYGRHGTQTTFALADAVCRMEGGAQAVIVPNGLAAIICVFLAYAKQGAQILAPQAIYAPARRFLSECLPSMGGHVEFYDTDVDIRDLLRPETALVYCESPGSQTFDVQDIPAICKAAHERGIPVAADNTWATPYFYRPFEAGLDISIQAGTKYISGHSDIMIGTITTNDACWKDVRRMVDLYGYSVSPDDCYLALRGIRTMPVRLQHQYRSALTVAGWLEKQSAVQSVNYPCLASHPAHELWKRQMNGGASLFAFSFTESDREKAYAFANALEHFSIGSSWGGYESLISIVHAASHHTPDAPKRYDTFRLHIGLESPEALLADLANAMREAGY